MKIQTHIAILMSVACLILPSVAKTEVGDAGSSLSDPLVLADKSSSCVGVAAAWSKVSDLGDSTSVYRFINEFGHCSFFLTIATEELHRLTVDAEAAAARAEKAVKERDLQRGLIRDLRQSLQVLEADLGSLKQQRDALVASLGDAQVTANVATGAAAELEGQLRDERSRYLQLDEVLLTVRNNLTDTRDEVTGLNKTIAERQRRIEFLEGELGAISETNAALMKDLSLSEEALLNCQIKIADLSSSLAELRTKRKQAEADAYNAQAQLKRLQADIDAAKNDIVELERKLHAKREETSQLERILLDLNNQVRKLRNEAAIHIAELADRAKQVETLVGTVNDLKNTIAKQDEALTEQKNVIEDRNAAIAEQVDDINYINGELSLSQLQNEALIEQRDEARTEVNRLQAKGTKFQAEIDTLSEENTRLEKELFNARALIAQKEELIEGYRAQLLVISHERDDLIEERDGLSLELADLIALIEEMQGRHDEEIARLKNEHQADLEKFSEQINALQAYVLSLKTLIADRDRQIIKQNRLLDSANNEIADQNARISNLQERIDELVASNKGLQMRSDEIIGDIGERNKELHERLTEMEMGFDLQITAANLDIQELSAKNDKLNDDKNLLETDKAELINSNADLKNQNIVQRQRINETETEINALKLKYEDLITTHEKLLSDHVVTLEQLQRMRSAVDALHIARQHLLTFLTDVFGNDDCTTQNDGRFSFCSAAMFELGSDVLSQDGRDAVGAIASKIDEIDAIIEKHTSAVSCPKGVNETWCAAVDIDWILRIDGHTDDLRIHPTNTRFQDNWDLSAARAHAVVRYMIKEYGVDPMRLAATGFGQHHPIADNATEEGRARNRRIDISLSHR